MKLQLHVELNSGLFLRDPEGSKLGKNIIEHSIILIHQLGFEAFTFKKLATEIGTTEAGIYRYFENKHLLLIYLVDWYWSWQEFRLVFRTNNITDPVVKLQMAISLLSSAVVADMSTPHVDEALLYEIVRSEGAKAYLTRHVEQYNDAKLFKPYKDLCKMIADIISEINPSYKYPRSLSSTIIEMAHSQSFYMKYLPSLTDFGKSKDDSEIAAFLEHLVLSTLQA